MLAQLTVRNVVLIERLVLELGRGFNVVTGETGAGKSMVVDALTLALGGRARPDLVRAGQGEAEVEALLAALESGDVDVRSAVGQRFAAALKQNSAMAEEYKSLKGAGTTFQLKWAFRLKWAETHMKEISVVKKSQLEEYQRVQEDWGLTSASRIS